MKKLSIVVLLTFAFHTVLICALRFAGRYNQGSMVNLHLKDCPFPCWIGILPGKTPIEDTASLVRSVYGDDITYQVIETYSGFEILNKMNGQRFEVQFGYWKGFYQIRLIPKALSKDTAIRLGDIINLLMLPDKVLPAHGTVLNRVSSLFYFEYGIEVEVEKISCDRLNIDQPVLAINIFDELGVDDLSSTTTWHGFTCYDR